VTDDSIPPEFIFTWAGFANFNFKMFVENIESAKGMIEIPEKNSVHQKRKKVDFMLTTQP